MTAKNNYYMIGTDQIGKDNIAVYNSHQDTVLHHHGFIEIVYFKSGQGVHIINGKTYPIGNGNICIINTGVEHYYRINSNQKKEIEVTNIIFFPSLFNEQYHSDNFIDEIYESLMHQPAPEHRTHIQISQDCNKDFYSLITLIQNELLSKEVGYLDIVKYCLHSILIKIFRQSSEPNNISHTLLKNVQIVEDAISFLEQNYKQTITLSDMAKEFNYSSVYFNTLFKHYTGTTFHKYLQKLRCEKAKEMLRKTDLTVAAICENVGYQDIKQFFILFKKIVGLTPSEYRKKHRQKTSLPNVDPPMQND